MKLLVIGLDGTDRKMIETFNMPFLRSVLEGQSVLPVKEDLWSRGWVKMLSGQAPTITGAFYEKPSLNGKPQFDQAYGSGSYPPPPSKRPLWEELDNMGVGSAWFNLPTTLPAPQVKGFVVSGAGGGFSPGARIPAVACHPAHLQNELIADRIIWENRFVVSGIRSTDMYMDRCIDAVWRRTKFYCQQVAAGQDISFGFIAHKEPTLVANVYMHGIQQIYDGKPLRTSITYWLNQFFEALDDSINYMVDRLQPEQVMVVSDHGAAPYRKSMNFNVMLQDLGFLTYKAEKGAAPVRGSAVQKLKARFAHEVRQVTNSHPRPDFPPFTTIDFDNTKAFTNFYVPGIFLYDQRFGGQAMRAGQAQALTDAIVRDFNAHSASKANQLVARPFRREHAGTPAYDLLPEVWVDHPVDLFPEQRGQAVQKNPYYRDWSDLAGLPRDIGSGKKSPDALCVVDPRFLRDVDPTRPGLDLTVVHELVLNHFRS